jgi:3-hydroxybutyryl-CoA dehydrogenase
MNEIIGIIGAGTMGVGIAQVALQSGHQVILVDSNAEQLEKAKLNLSRQLTKMVDKGIISLSDKYSFENRIQFSMNVELCSICHLIIEAVVENLTLKHQVFETLEKIVSESCILASNTSSFSMASIGSVLKNPNRVIGIHFFNPAPVMPLVEIIPAIQTSSDTLRESMQIIANWGKTTLVCKDTPGFIVNRIARPYYGEALRIFEEGIADFATIDWAMTYFGGFKMGPFALMDFIGNDVNYTVTESIFHSLYFDTRFKPSVIQKRYVEAGFYGRKTGRGYYDYSDQINLPVPNFNEELGKKIFNRILIMLINGAYDSIFMQIADSKDIDLATIKGLNFPKGLISWSNEMGLKNSLHQIQSLFDSYGEDRYRPSPLLKEICKSES